VARAGLSAGRQGWRTRIELVEQSSGALRRRERGEAGPSSSSADLDQQVVVLPLLAPDLLMAPLDQLVLDQQPFRVHLTGFGVRPHLASSSSPRSNFPADRSTRQPFGAHSVNASWETVRPLDGTVLDTPPTLPGAAPADSTLDTSSRRRPIHLSTSLLPVKYSAVLSSVPALHALDTDTAHPPYDLVIHCGVSGDDRAVRLEQRARKFGYDKEDVDGELAQRAADGRRGFSGAEWAECPEELRTTVNTARVWHCARKRGVEHLSPSQDAGASRSHSSLC